MADGVGTDAVGGGQEPQAGAAGQQGGGGRGGRGLWRPLGRYPRAGRGGSGVGAGAGRSAAMILAGLV